jgi:hypothetical protein
MTTHFIVWLGMTANIQPVPEALPQWLAVCKVFHSPRGQLILRGWLLCPAQSVPAALSMALPESSPRGPQGSTATWPQGAVVMETLGLMSCLFSNRTPRLVTTVIAQASSDGERLARFPALLRGLSLRWGEMALPALQGA